MNPEHAERKEGEEKLSRHDEIKKRLEENHEEVMAEWEAIVRERLAKNIKSRKEKIDEPLEDYNVELTQAEQGKQINITTTTLDAAANIFAEMRHEGIVIFGDDMEYYDEIMTRIFGSRWNELKSY